MSGMTKKEMKEKYESEIAALKEQLEKCGESKCDEYIKANRELNEKNVSLTDELNKCNDLIKKLSAAIADMMEERKEMADKYMLMGAEAVVKRIKEARNSDSDDAPPQ